MGPLRLYARYAAVSIRSQMQYRASFIMLSLSTFAITGVEFVAIWVMFDRFGSLQGWRLAEVALFYGTINAAFAIAESTARGFDTFSELIKHACDGCCFSPRLSVLVQPRLHAKPILQGPVGLYRVSREGGP